MLCKPEKSSAGISHKKQLMEEDLQMKQEQIAGIILCIIGILFSAKPALVWKLAESWKTEKSDAPSGRYMRVLRIFSGAALGVGVLLVAGILK